MTKIKQLNVKSDIFFSYSIDVENPDLDRVHPVNKRLFIVLTYSEYLLVPT